MISFSILEGNQTEEGEIIHFTYAKDGSECLKKAATVVCDTGINTASVGLHTAASPTRTHPSSRDWLTTVQFKVTHWGYEWGTVHTGHSSTHLNKLSEIACPLWRKSIPSRA